MSETREDRLPTKLTDALYGQETAAQLRAERDTLAGQVDEAHRLHLSRVADLLAMKARAEAAEARVTALEAARDEGLRMKVRPALAQLRHAYWLLTDMTSGAWVQAQRREFAEGLIAPQVRRLEELEAALTAPKEPA